MRTARGRAVAAAGCRARWQCSAIRLGLCVALLGLWGPSPVGAHGWGGQIYKSSRGQRLQKAQVQGKITLEVGIAATNLCNVSAVAEAQAHSVVSVDEALANEQLVVTSHTLTANSIVQQMVRP